MTRKELKQQYKERKVVGGVYRLINRESGRFYLQSTDDIQGTRNWYAFTCSSNICTLPPIQEDWKKLGGRDAFELEELELLEKEAEQTTQEFRGDIKALYEMWDEKLPRDNRY